MSELARLPPKASKIFSGEHGVHIVCLGCGARLSEELRVADLSERNTEDRMPYVPRGATVQEDDTFFHQHVGEYVVNVDDAIHTWLTEAGNRLNGCCGLDGMDGPNLLCDQCGAEVAIKKTDCWMPHCVIFVTALTRIIA